MVWEVFMLDAFFFVFGAVQECFSGEGWNRSLNSLIHTF